MTELARSHVSCGVYELWNLYPTSDLLLRRLMAGYKYQATHQFRERGFAQVVWSDADENGNGERFAKYIRKNFPSSTLVKCSSADSPSTGRNITTWVWAIPHVALKRHKFYKNVRARIHFND